MKNLLFACCLIIFFISCKKDKEKSTRTIQGHIYHTCNMDPLQNNLTYEVKPFTENYNGLDFTSVGFVTLDENGFYSLTYESDIRFDGVQIEEPGYGGIIRTGYENNLNLTHYISPVTTHRVVLQVSDTMSIHDTLYFSAVGLKDSLITGPFHGGQSFEIEIGTNVGRANGNDFVISSATGVGEFWWFIGFENWKNRFNPNILIFPHLIRSIDQPVCGQGETIYIDLRNE